MTDAASASAREPADEVVYEVSHRTTYRYGVRMSTGATLAHLTPRATPLQRVLASDLSIEPTADERTDWDDPFGNRVTYVSVNRPHDSLELVATSTVAIVPSAFDPTGPRPFEAWDAVAAALDDDRSPLGLDARSYRVGSRLGPTSAAAREYAAASFPAGRDLVDAMADLCHRIYSEFEFDSAFSDTTTPVSDVLEHRRGVCQDFAHLALSCLRSLRLPGRYVSGYIETEPPPGQEKLVGSDASHAWVAFYVPALGWIDVDPTNDQLPTRRHITVGWGRDYADVAPVQGVVFGPNASQVLEVAVDVRQRVPC
ncbi:MAG: transglutaminase N-terminal domain-containing protein [Acidimicrobiia bacterium]